MSTIRSSTPLIIKVNETTVFTATNTGITISGSLVSTTPVVSASYALNAATASYALNAGGVSKGFVIAMAAAM